MWCIILLSCFIDDSPVTDQEVIDITQSSSSVKIKAISIETYNGSSLESCPVQPTITHSLTVSDRELSSINTQSTLDYNTLHAYFLIFTTDEYPLSKLSDETVTGLNLEPCPQPTTTTLSCEQSLVTSSISGTWYY